MALYPIAGSRIYIGSRVTASTAPTLAEFSGETWTQVTGWANAGAIGREQELITQTLIDDLFVEKAKGTINGGSMANQFVPRRLDPGQILMAQAVEDCNPWRFRVIWSANCAPESVVTVTVADPAVVAWVGHGLLAGQPVVFSNEGGALPTGLTAGTVYYVSSAGLTADAFTVSLTAGGAAVAVTAAGTGTTTATAAEVGSTQYFRGLVMPSQREGGDANTLHMRNWTIEVTGQDFEV